jgi:hypothetical protein
MSPSVARLVQGALHAAVAGSEARRRAEAGTATVVAVARDRETRVDFGDFEPDGDLGPGNLDDYLDDEDLDLKEAFGLPDSLPPLRLPPEPELAAMSRAAPLLVRARRLAEWVGPGREVTWDVELTAGDTVAAARALGITVPVRPGASVGALPGMPDLPAIASMQDVPELARLWDIALGAGFLELDIEANRVHPGEAMAWWPGGTDEEALDVWSTALPCLLDGLEDVPDGDAVPGDLLDFTGAGWALIVLLFLARGAGLQVREASDMIREAATDEMAPVRGARAWKSWTRAHGDPAEELLRQLAELGAVSLPCEPLDHAGGDGPVARLTPLGTWAARELLTEDGVEIPLLPPPGQMTAADLVWAAEGLDEEDAEAETAAWLAARAPDVAASELLAVAADGGAAARLLAVAAARKLGAAAEPTWRAWLGRIELRPYAKIALTEIAGGEPGVTMPAGMEPDAADVAWLLIDTLAAMADPPDDLPQLVSDSIPAGTEQQAFAAMSVSPHPDAASVLSLIGKHHPDKRIAKAARTSAFRAGSRPRTS